MDRRTFFKMTGAAAIAAVAPVARRKQAVLDRPTYTVEVVLVKGPPMVLLHGQPGIIIHNVALNDSALPGLEQANIAYMHDAMRAKWPNAQILSMRPWRRLESPYSVSLIPEWTQRVMSRTARRSRAKKRYGLYRKRMA